MCIVQGKLPKGGIGTIRHNYDNDDEKDDKRRQVEVGSIGPLIVYPLYYHIDVHYAWQKWQKGGISTINHNYDNDEEKYDKRRQVEVGLVRS